MSVIVENYGPGCVDLGDEVTTVTLPLNYVRDDVLAKRRIRATSTSGQAKVMDFLSANPTATLQEAADATGLSLPGVKKIVSGLAKAGLLVRDGSKKKGRWVVLK